MYDSVEVLWSQSTSGGGDGECVTVWRCCGPSQPVVEEMVSV